MAVQTRILSWAEVSQRAWGKEWNEPEPAYEFGGRKFVEPRSRSLPDEDASVVSVYADQYADDYS